MKPFFQLFFLALILQSCDSCGGKKPNKTLTYQNIIILSDMSDRIEPMINGTQINQQYPVKDTIEIHRIVDYFKNECVKPGEKIGDNSCISFSTFSNNNIAKVDIGDIKELGEKQKFINSTGIYADKGLVFELYEFENEVKNAYRTIRNKGLDIISALNEKIENGDIIKMNKVFSEGGDSVFINFENHIYVFTDGYLEYLGRSLNNQFYFGESEIQGLRVFCKTKNLKPSEALELEPKLGVPALYSEKNRLVNLHVLETHARDKNVSRMMWANDSGLRDNEILEAVWTKWAKESGFKSFEWKEY
jgi:hypothetical protein